jgi:hypothetical protein
MRTRRAFTGTVVGLDLSLTGAAACALPCPWDGDLSRVRMMPMAGYKLTNDATVTDQRERIIDIRDRVLDFCKSVQAKRITVEAYAFSASGKITMLAELCGVVKIDLWENWGVSVESVHASSARKLLLQKLPARDSKLFVKVNVQRLGGPALGWTMDQIDALVVANHALSTVGTALSFPGSWE